MKSSIGTAVIVLFTFMVQEYLRSNTGSFHCDNDFLPSLFEEEISWDFDKLTHDMD